MTELLTAAQMRAIEQAAIDSGEVTGLELMERAGAGVVEAIFEEWPELTEGERKAVILCGPGNNGGDGFVVARLLKERGWAVEVFLYGDEAKLPPDAKANCEWWRKLGGQIRDATEPVSEYLCSAKFELLVDAVFGTGLSRELPKEIRQWAIYSHDSRSPSSTTKVVAIDIASGICADSGRILGEGFAVLPGLTVTFHRPKVGHHISEGAICSGAAGVAVVDIGLDFTVPETLPPEAPALASFVTFECTRDACLNKSATSHKYTHGHALILSGPPGHGGAARLAARGALRIGAGLVTIACPPAVLAEHAAQLNAIMLRPFDGATGLAELLSDARLSSICLGPGLGLADATREMVEIALTSQKKCVLDADALSIYQNDEAVLFAKLHEGVVLTPHAGEFRRLFPDIAAKLAQTPTKGPAYSKLDATREAAARAGCTVLFKGPDTVIATPDGRAAINSAHYERAAPWLATAGSGDVLAGFVAGLLARGFAPMQAAQTAAWLHVDCARSFGPGLIAEDLPEELPKVFRALDL